MLERGNIRDLGSHRQVASGRITSITGMRRLDEDIDTPSEHIDGLQHSRLRMLEDIVHDLGPSHISLRRRGVCIWSFGGLLHRLLNRLLHRYLDLFRCASLNGLGLGRRGLIRLTLALLVTTVDTHNCILASASAEK